jgi:hypothetical protein
MIQEEQITDVKELVVGFMKRVKKDKDVAMAISGYEGDGKSTLAVQIVIEVLRVLGKTDEYILENFNDYMIYSPNKDEMFQKITKPEKYAPINSDEATKALYKLNWASSSQKFLNVLFQLCRKENKINILCIPRFTDLNEYFRNHRVMFWIHILETGTAVLMIRDWSPFSRDPWHIDENRKTIDESRKRKKLGDFEIDEKITLMKKARGFVSVLKWDDLDTRFKNVYLKGKHEHSYEGIGEDGDIGTTGRNEKYKEALTKACVALKQKGLSGSEIARTLDIGRSSVYDYLKSGLSESETLTNKNIHPIGHNFSNSMEEDNK